MVWLAFPELSRIIPDNVTYAKVVTAMGTRSNAAQTSFVGILSADLEAEVREAAKLSMGAEIGDEDMRAIQELCHQILSKMGEERKVETVERMNEVVNKQQ